MLKSSTIFMNSEGDCWFQRSLTGWDGPSHKLAQYIWARLPYKPRTVLEIGCADGLLLEELQQCAKEGGSELALYGVDPSAEAVSTNPMLHLLQGTADQLPFDTSFFDMIIFGFSLYLCDRQDLFKIAYEADRVLKENGFLVIYDFDTDFAYKNTYAHRENLYSHKMRYRDMFLWNPQYSLMEMMSYSHEGSTFHVHPNERISLAILYKSVLGAYDLVDPFA